MSGFPLVQFTPLVGGCEERAAVMPFPCTSTGHSCRGICFAKNLILSCFDGQFSWTKFGPQIECL